MENKLPKEMYPLCPKCKKQTVAGAHMTSNDSRSIYCTSGECNYDVPFEMLTTPVPVPKTNVTMPPDIIKTQQEVARKEVADASKDGTY